MNLFPEQFNRQRLYPLSEYQALLQNMIELEEYDWFISENTAPPQSAIDSLKRVTVGVEDESLLAKDCAICQEKFVTEAVSIQMPCAHDFHADCILPWLNNVGFFHIE